MENLYVNFQVHIRGVFFTYVYMTMEKQKEKKKKNQCLGMWYNTK